MIQLRSGMKSRMTGNTFRFATCWYVERTDGEKIRVTDHSNRLQVNGQWYSPTGGFSSSAREREANFRERNAEIKGFVNSNYITDTDLRAGKYQDAKVVELLVDSLVPWAGIFSQSVYYIQEVSFTGEVWQAQVIGMTQRIRKPRGDVYARLCRWDLGQSYGTTRPGCHINLETFTVAGVVEHVSTQRNAFKTDLTNPNGYFSRGVLTWTTGANEGVRCEVQSYKNLDGKIVLFLATPFDIEIGDEFLVHAGCAKDRQTCIDKFGNIDNFGGFPFMPGTDRMVRIPMAK